jgi:hypothetical protein
LSYATKVVVYGLPKDLKQDNIKVCSHVLRWILYRGCGVDGLFWCIRVELPIYLWWLICVIYQTGIKISNILGKHRFVTTLMFFTR